MPGREQAAGLDAKHADAIVDAVRSAVSENLATRTDLRELELRLTIRLGALIFAGVSLLFAALKLTT